MAMEDLSKTYLYDKREGWIDLETRDDVVQELLEGRLNPNPDSEWYDSLGYYSKPVVFGKEFGAQVVVYKQHSDTDKADYTFMCEVCLAGTTHSRPGGGAFFWENSLRAADLSCSSKG